MNNIEQENKNLIYYDCPKPLGYLVITIDAVGKVTKAIFVDAKLNSKVVPSVIKNALDHYFKEGIDIPSRLVSKEIAGTEFQKSIWNVISKVKFGKTITYTEMSEKASKPLAVRAAGTACGKNPVALFIPCHRVIKKSGEDYGYSWGIERKKWLLEFESDRL